MRSGSIALLAIMVSLLLRADSCVNEDRVVESVRPFSMAFPLDVSGSVAEVDTARVTRDLAEAALVVLQDLDDTVADTVIWVGAEAEFTRNEGFNTRRTLTLSVGEPGLEAPLFSTPRRDSIPDNDTGRSAIVYAVGEPFPDEFMLRVDPAGVQNLNAIVADALAEFLGTGDLSPRPLSMIGSFGSLRTESDPPDDFTLTLRLNFQVGFRRGTTVFSP